MDKTDKKKGFFSIIDKSCKLYEQGEQKINANSYAFCLAMPSIISWH